MAFIAQAPVRISFAGGGTDLPAYYRRYGGLVVSTAINRYVYTIVSNNISDSQQIISADYQSFYRRLLSEEIDPNGDLPLPKNVLDYFGVKTGIDIFIASQVPPGTGLGSSGAVTVSMVAALAGYTNRKVSKEDIAEIACHIEIDILGAPVGKQDQYASAFGGLNMIKFSADCVTVEPLLIDADALERIQQSILLFYTGHTRNSANSLRLQRAAIEQDSPEVIQHLHSIKAIGLEMRDALVDGNVRAFGELMHRSWMNKCLLAANISNASIDGWYELARKAGALGGKIAGAGGGGFLMLICLPEYQMAVTEALGAHNLRRMDFSFDFSGVRVVSTDTAQ